MLRKLLLSTIAALSLVSTAHADGPTVDQYGDVIADPSGFTQGETVIMGQFCQSAGPQFGLDADQPVSCHPLFAYDNVARDRLAMFVIEATYQGSQIALFAYIEHYANLPDSVQPVLAPGATGPEYLGLAPNKYQ